MTSCDLDPLISVKLGGKSFTPLGSALCPLPPLPTKVLSIHMEVALNALCKDKVSTKGRWSDLRNLFWDFETQLPPNRTPHHFLLHCLTYLVKYIFRRSLNLVLSSFPALWCTACICHTAGGHHGYPRMQQLQVHKCSGKNQSKLLILCQVDVSFSNLHG